MLSDYRFRTILQLFDMMLYTQIEKREVLQDLVTNVLNNLHREIELLDLEKQRLELALGIKIAHKQSKSAFGEEINQATYLLDENESKQREE